MDTKYDSTLGKVLASGWEMLNQIFSKRARYNILKCCNIEWLYGWIFFFKFQIFNLYAWFRTSFNFALDFFSPTWFSLLLSMHSVNAKILWKFCSSCYPCGFSDCKQKEREKSVKFRANLDNPLKSCEFLKFYWYLWGRSSDLIILQIPLYYVRNCSIVFT